MPLPKATTPAKISVDFTGVEIRKGGSGAHVPEGDYLLKVVGCERRPKKDDPSRFYLSWKLEIVRPTSYKGKIIYHRTSLSEESLWALRGFLTDLLGEKNVPQSKVDVPIKTIVDRQVQIGATLVDGEPYNGKVKSEIAATFSRRDYNETEVADDEESEELEEEEEEEETTAPKKTVTKTATTKKAAPVEEEEEEEEEIDLEDL
jgi:hypothetical protein